MSGMAKSLDQSSVEIIRENLNEIGDFALVEKLTRMLKNNRFEQDPEIENSLTNYPEVFEAYQQLIASTARTRGAPQSPTSGSQVVISQVPNTVNAAEPTIGSAQTHAASKKTSRAEIIKNILIQEREYSLLEKLAVMVKSNRFEPDPDMEICLEKYPAASRAYQQLIAATETYTTESLPSVGVNPDVIVQAPGIEDAEEQKTDTSEEPATAEKPSSGDLSSGGVPTDIEEVPPGDPHAYQPPEVYRHPSAVYCELGHTYLRTGKRYLEARRGDLAWSQWTRSAQAYREAIQLNRTNPQLRSYLSDVLELQQKPDEALKVILEAIPLDFHGSGPMFSKAQRLLSHETAGGIPDLEKVWLPQAAQEGLDPAEMVKIYQFLGRVRLYQEDYVLAVNNYQKSLAVAPDDLFALEGYGEALWRLGKTDQAIEALRRAVLQADSAHIAVRQERTRLKLIR
jgi:tetratricopeptide (TPR) repeat protein